MLYDISNILLAQFDKKKMREHSNNTTPLRTARS